MDIAVKLVGIWYHEPKQVNVYQSHKMIRLNTRKTVDKNYDRLFIEA